MVSFPQFPSVFLGFPRFPSANKKPVQLAAERVSVEIRFVG
jgi:hypothetical protein